MKRCLMIMLLILLTFSSIGVSSKGKAWFTIESDNFIVHFREEYEELAIDTVKIAENVHPVITTRLGHIPNNKTHIVLTDIGDEPGGLASPDFHNVITLFTAPIVGTAYIGGYSGGVVNDWLALLIIHEYVHIVHFDMAAGVYGHLRQVVGRVPILAYPNTAQSIALIEGLATYYETLLGKGIGLSRFWDMFLRAAVLDDTLLDLDQTLGYYNLGKWDPQTPYVYGYSWLAYLAQKLDDEVVSTLAKSGASIGILGGLNATINSVVGLSLAELYKEWQEDIKERYQMQLADIEEKGITSLEKLDSIGWMATRPKYSPTGKHLAYETQGDDIGFSIVIIDLTTGEQILMIEDASGGFSWTPDGEHIIYTSMGVQSGRRIYDLFALEVASGNKQRVTSGMRVKSPSVSADGNQIAYIQVDAQQMKTDLVVASLKQIDGEWSITDTQIWLSGTRDNYVESVVWEPEGHGVVVGRTEGNKAGIYRVQSPDTLIPVFVTKGGHVANPIFSPDGDYLLFESDHLGVSNIYAHSLESNRLYPLTNVTTGVFFPALGPCGTSLTLVYYTSSGYELANTPFLLNIYPDEAFTGEHWQLAAEKLIKQTETLPEVEMNLGSFSVRPYSPLSDLIPTWWLPRISYSDNGMIVGAFTAMRDATRRFYYSLSIDYSIGDCRPGATVQFQWNGNPWLNDGWTSSVLVSSDSVTGSQSLGTTFGYSLNTDTGNLHQFTGGTSYSNNDIRFKGGWILNTVSGYGLRQQLRQVGFELETGLVKRDFSVIGTWSERLQYRKRGAVGLHMGIGLAEEDKLRLDGSIDALTVRGLAGDDMGTRSGRFALGLSLEGEVSLLSIYRGIGTLPVFCEQLSIMPFIDVGVLAVPDITKAVTVGIELGVSLSLLYGMTSEITPTIGGALVFTDDITRPVVRLIGGIRF